MVALEDSSLPEAPMDAFGIKMERRELQMPPAAYTHRKRALPLQLSSLVPTVYRLCMLRMRWRASICMKQQVPNLHHCPFARIPSRVCVSHGHIRMLISS